MKKITQRIRQCLALLIALCVVLTISMPVLAEEENNDLVATEDSRESILLMTLGYEDDNGTYFPYKGGTCFLINDEYVLTNKHVVTLASEQELEDIRKLAGKPDLQATDSHIKLYLYVNRDMKVAATMHDSVNSDDLDFAAVKLAEKIYDRKPVCLGDSGQIYIKEVVYAMGFPADSIQTKNYNTKDDVSTVGGAISKLTDTGDVDIIEHTAPLNIGNSGGPLLDENNNVIGLNTFIAGKKNYSIQINYIKKAMDTFGIPYVTEQAGNSTTPVEPEAAEPKESEEVAEIPDNTAILAELQSALKDAKAVETKNYTEESIKQLDDCIGTAEAVLENDASQAAEIQDAADDLNDSINELEEKTGPNLMMILLIAAGLIIIIIIIIIVVVMSGRKKKTLVGSGSGIPEKQNDNWSQNKMNNMGSASEQTDIMAGAGETTLLNAGAGETTLLNYSGSAYLIRKKNGEKISVNNPNFKLGKERKRVNYCISDNTSVSRIHCEIVKKGADYYVTDQGATNFTFVNGVQLSPHQETLLSDQSILKLSDEEFEFHIS